MEWYSNLYLGEGLEKKKDKLIKKIETCAGTPGLYVITLASNEKNLLDIFSSDQLLWPVFHGLCPMIVGLCSSYDEAVDMAQDLILKSYEQNQTFHIEDYLKAQLPEGTAFSFHYPSEHLKRKKRLFWGKK